jgi:hypothetical protein
MFCQVCGAQNISGDRFCRTCRRRLHVTNDLPTRNIAAPPVVDNCSRKAMPWYIATALVISAVVLPIVAFGPSNTMAYCVAALFLWHVVVAIIKN